MITTKRIGGYAAITIVAILFISNLQSITCSSASEETENEVDAVVPANQLDIGSMCDCNDPEALYYKIVRQIINDQGDDGLDRFLKDFRPKRVCGSDGNRYENGCELECERNKSPDSDLHPVRGCRKRFNRHGSKNAKRRSSMKLQSERKSAPLKMKTAEESEPGKEQQKQNLELPHPRVCICPRHYFPVCASNGATYGNMCAFNCAKENIDPELTVTRNGRCDDDDETFL